MPCPHSVNEGASLHRFLLRRIPFLRVAQTVFLVNRAFAPRQTRGRFDENGKNDEFAFYPLKTRASLLTPPKTMKMTKMAGVIQAKHGLQKETGLFFPDFPKLHSNCRSSWPPPTPSTCSKAARIGQLGC